MSEDQLKGVNINKDDGEDVEGHSHKLAPASHKLANDEGDDVEGHSHKAAPASHKLANDEGDDVEAHMHKSVHKAQHKL